MTDQKLLELAALAAGIGPILCFESFRNCLRVGDRQHYRLWRPLDDDGDAMRLATSLQISISWFTTLQYVMVERRGFGENIGWTDDSGRDGAVRRAITVAAAQIGSTLP